MLGSNHRIFHNVSVWDPRHNSDHFVVMRCLRGASPREHLCYLMQQTRLPLKLLGIQTRNQADTLFAELRSAVPKTYKRVVCQNLRIAEETWRITDNRVYSRREPGIC